VSRRSLISEALAAVANEPASPPATATTETSGRVNFTNKRLEAFGEAARIVKRPTIRLKPAECSVWPGNARDYSLLDEHRLRSLIDSILAEGGNRIPAVVRRTPNGPLPYELVTGTRRHWAISWLNGNHYPDIDLIAIIEDLDDEAAFRLADIENREREDISDLERGINYKAAVDKFYGGVQLRMAERLKISKSQLARYIALTDIPPFLVSAFHSPMDLQAKYGEKLLPLLRDPASRAKLETAADQIASEQSFRRSGDEQPIAGAEVMGRLLKAMTARGRVQKTSIAGGNGKAIGEVIKDQQKILTLSLTPSDLSTDAILDALRPVIEAARIRGGKRK
jgi:ParB family chromosome partitioning protein